MLFFPQQFTHDFTSPLLGFSTVRSVTVCGMWGSWLFVWLVNERMAQEWLKKVWLIQDYSLPKYLEADDLVILSSYSGNTEEVLACAEQLLTMKCKVLVIAAGGRLVERAKTHNLPIYLVPTGMQPRMATGYYILYMIDLLSQLWRVSKRMLADLKNMTDFLEGLVSNFLVLAPQIASEIVLSGWIPIIYWWPQLTDVCRIWKIKLNENAKIQSFSAVFPELNHNEMCGYTKLLSDYVFLLLKTSFDHPRNEKRMAIFTELMEKKEQKVIDVLLPWSDLMEVSLWWMLLFDLISYYVAEKMSVDPEPVAMVEDFKKALW